MLTFGRLSASFVFLLAGPACLANSESTVAPSSHEGVAADAAPVLSPSDKTSLDSEGQGTVARSEGGSQVKHNGPMQGVIDRFVANGPQAGSRFPELTLYDTTGNKVDLAKRLTGKTTVVILGCLT